MERIWRSLCGEQFCPETNLFYDCRTSRNPERRFQYLPAPEEIAEQFPNPCGWSTGMEDCMLHAGSALEIMKLRNRNDEAEFALRVFDGIRRCATVHGKRGFLVRGITPRDGHSCYANSSRDQFTLATWGMYNLLTGFPSLTEHQKQPVRELLCDVAHFCETRITPENHWDLGRLDGHPALVSQMWQCAPHEVLRLPMIYAAAGYATNDAHWQELACRYLKPGLEISRGITQEACWDIPLAQFQLSLRVFRETGLFPDAAPSVEALMAQAAEYAERLLEVILAKAEAFDGDWYRLPGNWRRRAMCVTTQTLQSDETTAIWNGASYLNPLPADDEAKPGEYLRGIGNCLIALFSRPETVLSSSIASRLNYLLSGLDLTRVSGLGLMQLLHGLYLADERHQSMFPTTT